MLSFALRFAKNQLRLLRDRWVIERLASSVGTGRIDPRAIIRIHKTGAVRLGKNIVIGALTFISVEPDLHAGPEQRPWLEIGDDTYIGEMNNIRAAGGIRIGSKCLISQGVSIISANHSSALDVPIVDQPSRMDKVGVDIEDDVWIGTNTTILPGVRVGKGAIVAAGSVVTTSVPPFFIVAGVPARFLKRRG